MAEAHPEIAREWDNERNSDLRPDDFGRTSSHKAHWKCSKGHKWQAQIRTRTIDNTRCPYCSGKLPTQDTSLAAIRPDLAREWNYKKNGTKKPEDYLPASMASVWWICPEGHEWKISINNRYAGNNCPYCSNRKVGYGNDLATTHPDLARQWHPKKNGKLKPSAVVAGSSKRVCWDTKCNDAAIIIGSNKAFAFITRDSLGAMSIYYVPGCWNKDRVTGYHVYSANDEPDHLRNCTMLRACD